LHFPSGRAGRVQTLLVLSAISIFAACRGPSEAEQVEARERAAAPQRAAPAAPEKASPEKAGPEVRSPEPAAHDEESPPTAKGAEAQPGPEALVERWRMAFADQGNRGARISSIDVRSPAAGFLKPGDVVLSADRVRIRSAAELEKYLSVTPAGAPVLFEVLREGKRHFIGVQLPR